MIKAKKLLSIALITIIISISLPTTISAAVDVTSGQFTVLVDGIYFEPWGYTTAQEMLYLCLLDIAYMLNGTPAQFNILTPSDDRWDYWIVRGEPFTPTGIEFQPFTSTRRLTTVFRNHPVQALVVGIDGNSEPSASVAINAIQIADNTYFTVRELAPLLGIVYLGGFLRHRHIWYAGYADYFEEADLILATGALHPAVVAPNSPEFLRLSPRILGHWVDTAHFDSAIIDESVAWPLEFYISVHGINKPASWSVAPLGRPDFTHSIWERYWWHPVSVRNLENGLVELATVQPYAQPAWDSPFIFYAEDAELLYDLPSLQHYRIIVDTTARSINSITVYINDTPHIMRRVGRNDANTRYQVQSTPDGGIKFSYILCRTHNNVSNTEIRVYRTHWSLRVGNSVTNAAFGQLLLEPLFVQQGIARYDRIAFEFVDYTVENPRVYYYSIWSVGAERRTNITPIGQNAAIRGMRVDAGELLGLAEPETPEPDTYVYEITPYPTNTTPYPADAEPYTANAEPAYSAPEYNEMPGHPARSGTSLAIFFVVIVAALIISSQALKWRRS